MEPIKVLGANRVLNPPEGWDPAVHGECDPLYVHAHVRPNGGGITMTSAWKPDAEELAALAKGHPVLLTVYGVAIPPMAIGVAEDGYMQVQEDITDGG